MEANSKINTTSSLLQNKSLEQKYGRKASTVPSRKQQNSQWR